MDPSPNSSQQDILILRFVNNSQVSRSLWKRLWLSQLHNRHKHLLWRVLSGILPTKDKLQKILQLQDTTCFFCGYVTKYVEHLFLTCPIISCIWINSRWQIRINAFSDWAIDRWIQELIDPHSIFPLQQEEKAELLNFAMVTTEITWKYRNLVRTEGCEVNVEALCLEINKLSVVYWKASKRRFHKNCRVSSMQVKSTIKGGSFKINFDASVIKGEAVTTCLIKDHHGNILEAKADSFVSNSAYVAEAQAALMAFQLIEGKCNTSIIFEGDALAVIDAIKGNDDEIDWRGERLITEPRCFLKRFPSWSIHFVSRCCNSSAHELVQWARRNGILRDIPIHSLPPLVVHDMGGFCNDTISFVINE